MRKQGDRYTVAGTSMEDSLQYMKKFEREQRRMEKKLAENAEILQEELLLARVRKAVKIRKDTNGTPLREVKEFYGLARKVTDRRFRPIFHAAEVYGGLPCTEKE